MIYRIFSSALVAGLLSALLITGLQALITTPLIIQAESFEISSPVDSSSTNEDATEEWMPEDGDVRRDRCGEVQGLEDMGLIEVEQDAAHGNTEGSFGE